MTHSIRPLAGLTVAIAVAVGATAQTAPAGAVELKLGHFLPPVHLTHKEVVGPWAKKVEKLSGGSLKIKIYPARQLGGTPPAYYKMVKTGIADISVFSPNYAPRIFPRTSVIEQPVPPENSQHATRILHALFDKYIAPEYKDIKFLGIYTVDSFIAITKSKPIRKLEDIKGLKIRSPSATQNEIIKTLGAVPVNIPITGVFTAMDTGVIDGMTVGSSAVFSFKIADVGRYYTYGTPFSVTSNAIGMNKKVWNSLSAAHKKIIDDTTGYDFSMIGAKAYDAKNAAAQAFIAKRDNLHRIDLSAAEQERFRKAAEPVVNAWIAKMEKQGIPGREMWKARLAVK